MATKHVAQRLTQSITYSLVCLISLFMVIGSLLMKVNLSEETTKDQRIIEYSYQNEGKDPASRNRFRKVQIKLENILKLAHMDTKDMRVIIYRSGEIGDKNLQTGMVFSIVVEDMAKFQSVIFDYNKCVKETAECTDIVIFLFKRHDGDLALKSLIININRQTDKISMMGRELSTEDIWSDSLSNSDLLNNHEVLIDKGYLRVITGERP
jgi:hypothetical protein